jgi:nucleoside-diphosphate-sugar epimerase
LRLDLAINNLVAHAHVEKTVLVKSDGSPWRPFIHVADIAGAFAAVLNSPARLVHNEAFNIGRNDQNYQIRTIAELVRNTVPGSTIQYAEDAEPDKRCYRVDCSKIARLIPEFEARFDARQGIEELFAAYDHCALGPADLEGTRYVRIRRIRELMKAGALDETLRWRSVSPLVS